MLPRCGQAAHIFAKQKEKQTSLYKKNQETFYPHDKNKTVRNKNNLHAVGNGMQSQ